MDGEVRMFKNNWQLVRMDRKAMMSQLSNIQNIQNIQNFQYFQTFKTFKNFWNWRQPKKHLHIVKVNNYYWYNTCRADCRCMGQMSISYRWDAELQGWNKSNEGSFELRVWLILPFEAMSSVVTTIPHSLLSCWPAYCKYKCLLIIISNIYEQNAFLLYGSHLQSQYNWTKDSLSLIPYLIDSRA